MPRNTLYRKIIEIVFVYSYVSNESVNNQGGKLKNHKFWSVNSPPGAEFSLAPKMMQIYLAR